MHACRFSRCHSQGGMRCASGGAQSPRRAFRAPSSMVSSAGSWLYCRWTHAAPRWTMRVHMGAAGIDPLDHPAVAMDVMHHPPNLLLEGEHRELLRGSRAVELSAFARVDFRQVQADLPPSSREPNPGVLR
jgi:hypothetical protein